MNNNIGIYVHIPFCISKCAYCDFNSYSGKSHLQHDYINALLKEIKYSSKSCHRNIDTIYIGGGTPSTLFEGAIQTIVSEIKKHYIVLDNAEISMEANPNSITLIKALQWRDAGVNRVSVGLQTTRKSALSAIGRVHTKADYINAMKILHDAGFNNINTDLMIGLPKQKSSDVRYAVSLANKMGSTHISCYSLILEEGTRLYNDVQEGRIKLPKEAKVLGMYNTAFNYLSKYGYNRYEVSNFAYSGYECQHNLNCWDMHEYLGFGAGAHGYIDNMRYNNLSGIEEYINAIYNSQDAREDKYICSKEDTYEEAVMLGLRKTDGVDIGMLTKLLEVDFYTKYKDVINRYKSLDMIEIVNDRLRVTDKGMFVLNQIILDFVV